MIWSTALCLLLSVVILVAGDALGFRYCLTSTAIVVLSMVPFAVSFESRRPQAREIVVLAVMCAIAVVSRVVFAGIPHVKPLVGIVMITGIAFGGQAGFLTGTLAALVSNFIFGQGPWTPWQMLAYGLAGLLAGGLARAGLIPRGAWSMPQRIGVSVLGFLVVVCMVGPILDTCTVFTMVSTVTPEAALAVYSIGFATANVPHAIATFATLFLVGSPMLAKLNRVRVKYGFMEAGKMPK
ncbi:MAG: ECF transporter S component [Eggerthellaceae bacterium]|nr:ECF transporter S component [Eggerthellaceae bacterium]